MISLDSLPHQPGCYIFSDDRGTVIYVGKARDLKKRISNYFQKQDHVPRTQALVSAARKVDYIVTNTEVEALLLENTLIKKHMPRYNIKLKDSSRYACIQLTQEEFPRIRISRRAAGKGQFFGPFTSARERTFVYQIVRKTFGLATCKRLPKRACLRYHLGHCTGPCLGRISEADYRAKVERAAAALGGKTGELIESMKRQMAELSERMEFERALELETRSQPCIGCKRGSRWRGAASTIRISSAISWRAPASFSCSSRFTGERWRERRTTSLPRAKISWRSFSCSTTRSTSLPRS